MNMKCGLLFVFYEHKLIMSFGIRSNVQSRLVLSLCSIFVSARLWEQLADQSHVCGKLINIVLLLAGYGLYATGVKNKR